MAKSLQSGRSLEWRVRRFVEEQCPPRGAVMVVAVSGGHDSVCLLHVLCGLRDELGLGLHAAHLDHQLRGAESRRDARYVVGLCRRLGVPVTVERRDVRTYRAGHGLSLEEAARVVRYDFLSEVAVAVGASCVAVGHTRHDHAETVLLHLIRGSGTTGLRGLQPVSHLRPAAPGPAIVRPMLDIGREETVEYCRRHRLRPRVDASNLSLSPLRNRVRHKLLPIMEECNPRIVEGLARTAGIISDDVAWLEEEVGRLWAGVAHLEGDAVVLGRHGLLRIPRGQRRNVLRRALAVVMGNVKDIEARHVDELVAALELPPGRRINLPGGLWFSVEYERYVLGADPAALSPFPELLGEITLRVPGEVRVPGWRIEAAVLPGNCVMGDRGGFTACFDLARTGDSLTVRTRLLGDRFQPLGMTQMKKLGQFMIDARVPRAWRDRVPVVCSGDRILWVVGYRVDDRARVVAGTRALLRLRFERRADE